KNSEAKAMHKRNGGKCGLIVRAGALALGVVSAPDGALSQTQQPHPVSACGQATLTMSSWVPSAHHLTSVVLQGFADEVEQASGGRLQFRMLPRHPIP